MTCDISQVICHFCVQLQAYRSARKSSASKDALEVQAEVALLNRTIARLEAEIDGMHYVPLPVRTQVVHLCSIPLRGNCIILEVDGMYSEESRWCTHF